jgi:hypothetical protein
VASFFQVQWKRWYQHSHFELFSEKNIIYIAEREIKRLSKQASLRFSSETSVWSLRHMNNAHCLHLLLLITHLVSSNFRIYIIAVWLGMSRKMYQRLWKTLDIVEWTQHYFSFLTLENIGSITDFSTNHQCQEIRQRKMFLLFLLSQVVLGILMESSLDY